MAGMSEDIVYAIIREVFDLGVKYMLKIPKSEEKLKEMGMGLLQIQAMVEGVESGRKKMTSNARQCLDLLKDRLDDAEDVVDSFIVIADKEEEEESQQNRKRVRFLSLLPAMKILRSQLPAEPDLYSLDYVIKEFIEASVDANHILLKLPASDRLLSPGTTTVVGDGDGPAVFGRDDEKMELVQHLITETTTGNVSLVSLVGLGGIGKTTLAKLVYNDEGVKNYFECMLWVFVSDRSSSSPIDVKRITRDLLCLLGAQDIDNLQNLYELQVALKNKLTSKRFLLVLDDVWNEDVYLWEDLFEPLRHGREGSRILLTTRTHRVAKSAGTAMGNRGEDLHRAFQLKTLKEADSLALLKECSITCPGVKSIAFQKLEAIAEKALPRVGNLPLAVKAVGAELHSNFDEDHWNKILHTRYLSKDSVIETLRSSYYRLPKHLRPCFAYCAMFPRLYEFKKEDMVFMWIALGFIRKSLDESGTLETIGGLYFDDLIARSFFQTHHDFYVMTNRSHELAGSESQDYLKVKSFFQSHHDSNLKSNLSHDEILSLSEMILHTRHFFQPHHDSYIMHNLLHDLAQSVSPLDCLTIIDDVPDYDPCDQRLWLRRHLYVKTSDLNVLKHVCQYENLRSLLLFFDGFHPFHHHDIFRKLFQALKKLRVLKLWVNGMEVLPDEVGELKHLRYLELHPTILYLPGNMHKLYHLQVLKAEKCSSCIDLPKGLRHLMVPSCSSATFSGIRKLSSLQVVSFSVQDIIGYKIEEMKDLRELRRLEIRGLENIKSCKEAGNADLHGKELLTKLELNWSSITSYDETSNHFASERKVIQCLQPHSNIKELTVRGYNSSQFASWMKPWLLYNLEFVKFENCSQLRYLPSLGKLPSLRFLYLAKLPAVSRIDCEGHFPKLEVLQINNLKNLKEWSALGLEAGQWCPRLRQLLIICCPLLKKFPSLPFSLRELTLVKVGLTEIPTSIMGDSRSSSTSTSSSSFCNCSLVICECEELTSLGSFDDPIFRHGAIIHRCPKLWL